MPTVRLTLTTTAQQSSGNRPSAPVPEVANAQANARGAFFDEPDVDNYRVSEHGDEDEDGNSQSRTSVSLEKEAATLDDISSTKDALAQAAVNQGLVSSTSDIGDDQYSIA